MIHHHLSDEMIMAYAAGSLSAGQAMVVACHLELCPHCAACVVEAEAVGGAMIEQCDHVAVSDDLFETLLNRLDESPRAGHEPLIQSAKEPKLPGRAHVPELLARVVGGDLGAIRWRAAGPGVRQYLLPIESSEGEKVRLLKLSPGFVTPEHSHHGSELTLVLKGSFSDESGRYRAGDIQDADGEIHHQPMADTDEDCICLVCTDAPLEFKGVITRLLQPIIGI